MQQFFIGLALVLGLACWWLYGENQTLTQNNAQLQVAIEQQEEAMEAIKDPTRTCLIPAKKQH